MQFLGLQTTKYSEILSSNLHQYVAIGFPRIPALLSLLRGVFAVIAAVFFVGKLVGFSH